MRRLHNLLGHTPPLPTVVEGLRRTILPRWGTETQAIAIDEDNAAQHTPVVDTGLSVALGNERFNTDRLRVRQPEEVAH